MSDGVNITTPDGTVKVATDDAVTAGHVQILKLAVSADGSAALIPADAANGLDVDVTRLPSLPAGANGIGTVGVTALPAGTLAAAAARTADLDTGGGTDTVPIMGVALPKSGGAVAGGTSADPIRTDPTGTTAQPVTDNGGTLSVDDGGGSLTVDGTVAVSGTVPVSAAALPLPAGAATEATLAAAVKDEDAAHASGDKGVMALGVRNDSNAARTSADGDYGALALDSAGRAKTELGTIAGTAVDVNSGAKSAGTQRVVLATDQPQLTAALKVDGSAVTQPVSGTVTVAGGKAEDAAAADGDPGVPVLGVRNDALAARTSTDGDYGMVALDNAGRVHTVPGGGVAHDGADSGSPVKVGGRARTSDIAAVASDDRTDMVADTLGRQVVTLDQIPENSLSGKATFSNTTAADVIAAQGAGIRIHVTDLVVTNAHASVGTKVEIRDGTTVLWQAYAAPGGGGFAHRFRRPLRLSANSALTARCVTTGADVDVNASGFKAAI